MDLHLWGRVEHIGPEQFLAIASAVPDLPLPTEAGADVLLQLASSREEAKQTLQTLVLTLGEQIRARGDRVVDVLEDGAI